jgi:ribosome-associated heat shock protein Hsp15
LAGPSARHPRRPDPEAGTKLRLDKWLWQARFAKSRSLAAALIDAGSVRVNGIRVTRPGRDVTPGDTLTFPQGNRIRLVRILALGQRRGPAFEAQALYLDLDPSATPDPHDAVDAADSPDPSDPLE